MFFPTVSIKEEFETKLFLKNDIRALRMLGHEVVLCNRFFMERGVTEFKC